MYRKDIERTCLNKLTNLVSSNTKKICSKSFSDASHSSDIEEERDYLTNKHDETIRY